MSARDFGPASCRCGAAFTKRAPNQVVCPACRKRKRGANPKLSSSSWSNYTPAQRRVHRALRKHYQQRMDAGEVFHCWRCAARGVVTAINPRRWDLGHDDHDRDVYRGPECIGCNRATYKREPKRLVLCAEPTRRIEVPLQRCAECEAVCTGERCRTCDRIMRRLIKEWGKELDLIRCRDCEALVGRRGTRCPSCADRASREYARTYMRNRYRQSVGIPLDAEPYSVRAKSTE